MRTVFDLYHSGTCGALKVEVDCLEEAASQAGHVCEFYEFSSFGVLSKQMVFEEE